MLLSWQLAWQLNLAPHVVDSRTHGRSVIQGLGTVQARTLVVVVVIAMLVPVQHLVRIKWLIGVVGMSNVGRYRYRSHIGRGVGTVGIALGVIVVEQVLAAIVIVCTPGSCARAELARAQLTSTPSASMLRICPVRMGTTPFLPWNWAPRRHKCGASCKAKISTSSRYHTFACSSDSPLHEHPVASRAGKLNCPGASIAPGAAAQAQSLCYCRPIFGALHNRTLQTLLWTIELPTS